MSERCERTSERRSEGPNTPRVEFHSYFIDCAAMRRSKESGNGTRTMSYSTKMDRRKMTSINGGGARTTGKTGIASEWMARMGDGTQRHAGVGMPFARLL